MSGSNKKLLVGLNGRISNHVFRADLDAIYQGISAISGFRSLPATKSVERGRGKTKTNP